MTFLFISMFAGRSRTHHLVHLLNLNLYLLKVLNESWKGPTENIQKIIAELRANVFPVEN